MIFTAIVSDAYEKKQPVGIKSLKASLPDAIKYLRENKGAVDGWFANDARVPTDLIHSASMRTQIYADQSFNVTNALFISPETRQSLEMFSALLFQYGLTKSKVDVGRLLDN